MIPILPGVDSNFSFSPSSQKTSQSPFPHLIGPLIQAILGSYTMTAISVLVTTGFSVCGQKTWGPC